MLGNFSFGDYFKQDAIQFAWEFLTITLKIPQEKLWVTVYSEDDEAADIWLNEVGIVSSRLVRIATMDNFWQMGDTGPCGPCSEIFYDHGPEFSGGAPGTLKSGGDRYIEIWNLVFMQYNRDSVGKLHPLPRPSVDTGMGLERISAVIQHVHSNYEIDLFQNNTSDLTEDSLKVIADHIRACSFLITDGVIPDNEGRGYVLRRIIRRAIRHGYKLGQKQPFFYKLVKDLVDVMGLAYPELVKAKTRVASVLKQEEERFGETLVSGMQHFEKMIGLRRRGVDYIRKNFIPPNKFFTLVDRSVTKEAQFDGEFHLDEDEDDLVVKTKKLSEISDIHKFAEEFTDDVNKDSQEKNKSTLGHAIIVGNSNNADREADRDKIHFHYFPDESSMPVAGLDVFTLYDTFGFPFDLTQDLCRERGLSINMTEFEIEMDKQRERARGASKFTMQSGMEYDGCATQFHGYESLQHEGQILAIYKKSSRVDCIKAGDEAVIVLDHTPFYAESGGQVGDRGELLSGSGTFTVAETQKIQTDVFGHRGQLNNGRLAVNDKVSAEVDPIARARTERNHSVTHLMHKALREVLGAHVQQKGSLVDADKTRFDFAHNLPMTDAEIREVEVMVNAEIFTNTKTDARVMKMEDAQKTGALMLFGEKYGDEVRVLGIGSSRELCGGTHVNRTGDIGLFKIRAQSGVAAGIRRVEAVTGEEALEYVQQNEIQLLEIARALKTQPEEATQKISQIIDNVRRLEKDLSRLKSKLASAQGDDVVDQVREIKGVNVLAVSLEGVDAKTMRETLDRFKNKLKSCIVVLGTEQAGKVTLIAGVTADLTAKVKAGDLVNFVALQVGGKGGGRADIAQAGGTQPDNLPTALDSVADWVKQQL
jgi:alanyl-tRNA synthetase